MQRILDDSVRAVNLLHGKRHWRRCNKSITPSPFSPEDTGHRTGLRLLAGRQPMVNCGQQFIRMEFGNKLIGTDFFNHRFVKHPTE